MTELRAVLSAMAQGSCRANGEIVSSLREVVIDDGESAERGTRLCCELVTKQPWVTARVTLGASSWRDAGLAGPMSGSWLRDFGPIMKIVFELYESDFGSTRRTLAELTREDPRVPYLRLILMHALFDHGLAPEHANHLRRVRRGIEELLGEDARLLAWAAEKRRSGALLKELAGLSHTILGMYDWVMRSKRSGHARFPLSAEAKLDLGGGYCTPDLSRLLGIELLSLDLHPPSRARAIGIPRFQIAKRSRPGELLPPTRWQTDREAESYFEALERQSHRPFDIFSDAFDASASSYFITSFGFLSSTVASHSAHTLTRAELGKNVLSQMYTTYRGVSRVMDLVAAGKDVGLLTYQRATSRAYLNVTVFLRFRDHRLSDVALFERPFQLDGSCLLPPLRRPS